MEHIDSIDSIHKIISEFVPVCTITSEITIDGNYISFKCNNTTYGIPIKPVDEETGEKLFPITIISKR